jgi:hypothetical protein
MIIFFNLTPSAFFIYARDFHLASKQWQADGYSPVPYYLICKSLELGLKAFILAKGAPIEIVKKKIGHNLEKAVTVAMDHSLDSLISFSDDELLEISRANSMYLNKGFEYFSFTHSIHFHGLADLPDFSLLTLISEKLLKQIEAFVKSTF